MVAYDIRKVYSEINAFLNVIDTEAVNKIPEEIREVFRKKKDDEYEASIDIEKMIEEEKLQEKTYDIIAALNLKYWCENEEERNDYRNAYIKNELEFQKKAREKYNPDNVFENTAMSRVKDVNGTENQEIIKVTEKKKSIFERIIDAVIQKLKIK